MVLSDNIPNHVKFTRLLMNFTWFWVKIHQTTWNSRGCWWFSRDFEWQYTKPRERDFEWQYTKPREIHVVADGFHVVSSDNTPNHVKFTRLLMNFTWFWVNIHVHQTMWNSRGCWWISRCFEWEYTKPRELHAVADEFHAVLSYNTPKPREIHAVADDFHVIFSDNTPNHTNFTRFLINFTRFWVTIHHEGRPYHKHTKNCSYISINPTKVRIWGGCAWRKTCGEGERERLAKTFANFDYKSRKVEGGWFLATPEVEHRVLCKST